MSAYKDHIAKCMEKEAVLRAKHAEYPPADPMDMALMQGEITEEEHRRHDESELGKVQKFFEEAPKKLDKVFAPYLSN